MSTLIVEVCAIEEIAPHPNADRLEQARTKNWWVIVPKDQYKVNDKIVYFPPDSIITEELAAQHGITKYCVPITVDDVQHYRIKAQRLRGLPSYGYVTNPDNPEWEVGTNVQEHYKVTKYEPIIHPGDGDTAPAHPAFTHYTDIENIGNYPGILQLGEPIIIQEKIHGTNIRIGLILAPNPETGVAEYRIMCGSHTQNRKQYDKNNQSSKYWQASTENTRALLNNLCRNQNNVILYGELYGPGIQDMTYGVSTQQVRYYDITVNNKYLNHDETIYLFNNYRIETPPTLYSGPYDDSVIRQYTDGPTTIAPQSIIKCKFKGREGVVIRPAVERYSPLLPGSGRVIFKSISADYLDRKNATDYQ